MHNLKLTKLLKTLSEKEFYEFGLFIKSPYFNRLNMVIKLFDLMKKHHPEYLSPALTKTRIFKKLYPGQKYNDEKFRNLTSDLLDLLLKYLTDVSLNRNQLDKNISLMRELIYRDQPVLFNKIFSKTKLLLEEVPFEDEKFFLQKLDYENVVTSYNQLYKNDLKEVIESQKRITGYLFDNFIISIFKVYSWMLNQQRILYKFEAGELRFLDGLMNHISANQKVYENNLYINLYFNIIKLQTEIKEIYYYKVREILLKNIKKIDGLAVKNVYTILGNYCQYEINKGNKKFEMEIFELDKDKFHNKIYKSEYIPYSGYRNTIIHAINVDELEWAEKFLNEYKNNLPKELRKSAYNCSCAFLYLWKKEYDKALEHLNKASTEELSFKLDIKSITAMIYFEQNQTESLLSLLDSYKHLISKSKELSENFKPYYVNFVRFIEKILKAKLKPGGSNIRNLKKEITDSGSFYRTWLLQKSDELNTVKKLKVEN